MILIFVLIFFASFRPISRVDLSINERDIIETNSLYKYEVVVQSNDTCVLELECTPYCTLESDNATLYPNVPGKNFSTTSKFIINFLDGKESVINYRNISISRIFYVFFYSNFSELRLYANPLVMLEKKKKSREIEGIRTQYFFYRYKKKKDTTRYKSTVQLEVYSNSKSTMLEMKVYSYLNAPNGAFKGDVEFSVYPGAYKTLTQDVQGMKSGDLFYMFKSANPESEMNSVRYQLLVYPIYFFSILYFFYLIVFGFSILFVFFIVAFACLKCCTAVMRRNRNRRDDFLYGGNDGDTPNKTTVVLPQPDAQEYQKRRETIPENMVCCVCLDYRKVIMFGPCGHICCCDFCSRAVLENSGLCPLCRKEITDIQPVQDSLLEKEELEDEEKKEDGGTGEDGGAGEEENGVNEEKEGVGPEEEPENVEEEDGEGIVEKKEEKEEEEKEGEIKETEKFDLDELLKMESQKFGENKKGLTIN